jgi:hypothetical protein
MADVSFTPTFTHTPWVDNKDRVQAGGANGFNVRFSSLENDLQTLSTVVSEIDTVLDALAAGAGPVSHLTTMAPPILLRIGDATSQYWTQDVDGSSIPSPLHGNADGIMPVSVPNGATLTQFAVQGSFSGAGGLEVDFSRRAIDGSGSATLLASVVVGVTAGNSVAISGSTAVTDVANYYYFVRATVGGASSTTSARLYGIQITYSA